MAQTSATTTAAPTLKDLVRAARVSALAVVEAATAPFAHRYHPERHYMRGPGPAFRRAEARRRATS